MGIQNVYEDYDTRFEAFASFLKFVSPNVPNIPRFVQGTSRSASQASTAVDDYVKLFQPISEFDVTTTLYRGLSGREATKSAIYLTDNATVAATYVKNGMSVHSYKVTRFALFKLEQLGKLTHYTGKHKVTGLTKTEYVFPSKDLVKAINKIGTPFK